MEVNDGEGEASGRSRQEGPTEEPVVCTVCHRPANNHNVRHPFTPPGSRLDTSQMPWASSKISKQGDDTRHRPQIVSRPPEAPFDPILRKALIDKGIITIDDLDRASREIQAFTQAVTGGNANAIQGESGPMGSNFRPDDSEQVTDQ